MKITRRALAAGVAASAATMPALAQTPVSTDTKRYIGHDGRITADIPADWEGYLGVPDLMTSMSGGFIVSYASAGESMEALTEAAMAEMNASETRTTSVAGTEAAVITGGTSPMIGVPATRILVPYAEPFERWGQQMTHAVIDISPEAVEAILPTISLEMSEVTPQEYVHSLIDLAEANAIVTEEIDWEALRAEADTATDMDAVHAFMEGPMREAFRDAGDGHTHFTSPDLVYEMPDPGTQAPPELPTAIRAADGTLVITLPGADAGTQTEYMQAGREALASLHADGGCGVVIDLRTNNGGSVFPMVASVSPLLPDGPTFGFAYPGGQPPFMMSLEQVLQQAGATDDLPASDLDLTNQAVAVLFGSATASSGELTAISFVGREQTRSFGMESAGYTTSNSTFFLLDGWFFHLATSLMTDRDGNAYGTTMTPDEVVEYSGEQIGTSDDATLAAALDWLSEQSCDAPANATPTSATPEG